MSYELKILVGGTHFTLSAKSKKAAEDAAIDAGVNGFITDDGKLYFPPHKVDRIKISKAE